MAIELKLYDTGLARRLHTTTINSNSVHTLHMYGKILADWLFSCLLVRSLAAGSLAGGLWLTLVVWLAGGAASQKYIHTVYLFTYFSVYFS